MPVVLVFFRPRAMRRGGRRERPRKSTERRRSNADQSTRSIEQTPKGIEQKPRRSTHRRTSNSLSRFSCSAIDQSTIVPYQPSPARKPVKKSPVVINDHPESSSSSTDATEVCHAALAHPIFNSSFMFISVCNCALIGLAQLYLTLLSCLY